MSKAQELLRKGALGARPEPGEGAARRNGLVRGVTVFLPDSKRPGRRPRVSGKWIPDGVHPDLCPNLNTHAYPRIE